MSHIYYFGCASEQNTGHFLWSPWKLNHFSKKAYQTVVPWEDLDGGLQPKDPKQEQGVCAVHHKDGWTAIAFWDRSADTRRNSCSVIIEDKTRSFDEMVANLKEHFPDVWKRISAKFDLVERET